VHPRARAGSAELSHYSATAIYDIEYNFRHHGWSELEGIASRTGFRPRARGGQWKRRLTYFDEEANKQYRPVCD